MGLGLPAGLVASVLTLVAAGLAALFLNRSRIDPIIWRQSLVFFGVAGGIAPLLYDDLPVLLVVTILGAFLASRNKAFKIPFVISALLLFPDHYHYQVPFPGLNFLIVYQLWLGLVWAVLLPVIFRTRGQLRSADVLFVAFVLMIVVLDFREVSVTEGLRRALVSMSWFLIPYFAVSRGIRTRADFSIFQQTVLITALILCCATVMTQLVGWEYLRLTHRVTLFAPPEYRGGFLRTGATLSSGLFGLLCAMGLMVLVASWKEGRIPKTWRYLLAGMLLMGVMASGTRAVFVITPVMLAILFLFRVLSSGVFLVGVVSLLAGYQVVIQYVINLDTSNIENPYNIEYRQRLIEASLGQLSDKLWFGDPSFLDSHHFAALVQGQGIVDVVNAYLQLGLEHGIVTLILYLMAFVVVMYGMLKRLRRHPDALVGDFVVFSWLCGYLLFVGTTSFTSHVGLVGTVLLALGRATLDADIGVVEARSQTGANRSPARRRRFAG